MIKPITKESLLEQGVLFVASVREGLEQYDSAILKANNSKEWFDFFREVYNVNGNTAYGDFYYATLSEEQRVHFHSELEEKEQDCLESFIFDKDGLYYALTEVELEFLLGITIREWLFSTFYFTYKKITIWGNYKMEFPIFCEDKKVLDFYIEIAKKCGLECKR